MTQFRIGFDIGGSKVTGIALAPDGSCAAKERWPVPCDYSGLLDLFASAVRQLMPSNGTAVGVGLGVAGVVDHAQGRMAVCKLPWLLKKPLISDAEVRLKLPVRLANDADCFAVSEAADGAGAAYHHVFGVILGTGVGGGQVVGRKLTTGANGTNGEWGHLPLPHYTPDDAPPYHCHCGQMNCMENILSGGGLVRLHERLHGQTVTAPEIAAAAMRGDSTALATLNRYYDLLARGLTTILLCVDPEVIVIGGGLKHLPGMCVAVAERIPRFCFIKALKTAILPAHHDDDSGVRGAAWLI